MINLAKHRILRHPHGNDLLKSAPERAPGQSAARCAHPALQGLPCRRQGMLSIMLDMMLGIVMS